MQAVTKYPHATFSWIDANTSDLAAGKAFYTELFGWNAVDQPLPGGGVYTMLQLEGLDVAAISEMTPEMAAAGMPPVWNSYITVDNLDEVAARVEEAGGAVMAPPFDVMDAGRMAMVQDPGGAIVCLWEAKAHIGAQLVNTPGALVWNELWTPDAAKTGEFYTNLFGWQIRFVEEMNYHIFYNGDRMAAGMMEISEMTGPLPPHWSIYIAVEDCDATVAKAQALGATVLVPPMDIPETGRSATLQDPQGAMFNVITMVAMDPPPGV
jgi:predicted enzyme related to lactoylglutathione lyase